MASRNSLPRVRHAGDYAIAPFFDSWSPFCPALARRSTRLLAAGADSLHFDVMGHLTYPNLTIGPGVQRCGKLRIYRTHMMCIDRVKPVDRISVFLESGCFLITFSSEPVSISTGRAADS